MKLKTINIYIFIAIVLILWISLSIWNIYILWSSNIDLKDEKVKNIPTHTDSISSETLALWWDETIESWSDIVRQRIENIRKRHELRELLISAESYLEWWQQALWLKTLLDVYRENPEDGVVVTKIAETYFDMKRFWSSINYYKRLPSLNENQKNRMLLMSFYTNDIQDLAGREGIIREIIQLWYSQEEIFYYATSIVCSISPINCKEKFQEYIAQQENIQSTKLNDMRIALRNYDNFWVNEEYLLYTYIITEWYKQELYPLVILLWNKVLNEKSDYRPALKIIGHSYFELWEYEAAKEVLTKFHQLDDSDSWVNYMLGIIYAKTRDSVLANIFLRRALELWYSPTLNLRRHIAYNFALIESKHNLLRSLRDLIELEEEYEQTDLSLAVYYHILYEEYEKAIEFSKLWQERYPEDAYFYGYEWWAHREIWNPEKAVEILQHGLEKIENNPFLYLQLIFALKEVWNTESIKLVLETLLSLDISSEYREIALKEQRLLR